MNNDVDLPRHVSARRKEFEEIAQTELSELDKFQPLLWRAEGGWADEIDWNARSEDLVRKTGIWASALEEISTECRRIQAQRFARG